MTSIGSSSATASLRALTALYGDFENDIEEIGKDIEDVVNFKKGIHDALDFLRKNDVTGFMKFLDEHTDLKDKFVGPDGKIDGPKEDKPGTGRAEVSFDLFGQKIVLVPGREPDKQYSKDQIEGMKDRLKDVGDEVGQIATKLQLRFQMKNQGKTETFGAMSNGLKSEHDSAMTAVNNSKA